MPHAPIKHFFWDDGHTRWPVSSIFFEDAPITSKVYSLHCTIELLVPLGFDTFPQRDGTLIENGNSLKMKSCHARTYPAGIAGIMEEVFRLEMYCYSDPLNKSDPPPFRDWPSHSCFIDFAPVPEKGEPITISDLIALLGSDNSDGAAQFDGEAKWKQRSLS